MLRSGDSLTWDILPIAPKMLFLILFNLCALWQAHSMVTQFSSLRNASSTGRLEGGVCSGQYIERCVSVMECSVNFKGSVDFMKVFTLTKFVFCPDYNGAGMWEYAVGL